MTDDKYRAWATERLAQAEHLIRQKLIEGRCGIEWGKRAERWLHPSSAEAEQCPTCGHDHNVKPCLLDDEGCDCRDPSKQCVDCNHLSTTAAEQQGALHDDICLTHKGGQCNCPTAALTGK